MEKIILKFGQFIKEAKEAQEAQDKKETKKDKSIDLLKKLLKSKTTIEMSDKWPVEKALYSLSGIKKYFKDNGLTNNDADQAIHKLQSEKGGELKSVSVKNHYYGDSHPYYYITLSKEEAEVAKKKMEDWSKENSKAEIEKKKEISKKAEEGKKSKAEEMKAKRAKATTTTKKTVKRK